MYNRSAEFVNFSISSVNFSISLVNFSQSLMNFSISIKSMPNSAAPVPQMSTTHRKSPEPNRSFPVLIYSKMRSHQMRFSRRVECSLVYQLHHRSFLSGINLAIFRMHWHVLLQRVPSARRHTVV